MKALSFSSPAADKSIPCIYSAMRYTPRVYSKIIKSRKTSSLLYIISGEYLYRAENFQLSAESGNVLYLPKGASYHYQILSGEALCIQIEFDLMPGDFDDIFFSKMPQVVFVDKSGILQPIFEDIYAKIGEISTDRYKIVSDLFLLFSYFSKDIPKNELSRTENAIQPAINYINKYYNTKITICDLANQCHLSESQLRRLFHSVLHTSPMHYKNQLRIAKACEMILLDCYSITEISEVLAFDSVSDFCRCFKRIKGTTPKQYGLSMSNR